MTPAKAAKIIGLIVLAVFIVNLFFNLFGSTFRSFSMKQLGVTTEMPYYGGVAYEEADSSYNSYGSYGKVAPTLSTRNALTIFPPMPGGSVGGDAEKFEATDYSVTVESNNRDYECDLIRELKSRSYVVFENASETDTSCNYTFKVEHEHVEEILSVLKDLSPKDLVENTYTLQRQIEDFTSSEDILKKKLLVIEETMDSAIRAYDDITELATKTQNVESLAKIIDSRLGMIERLTNERLSINQELEYLRRTKESELDKLDYTRFYVSVYENKIIDAESLSDSWKAAVKKFVSDVNRAIQNATINLLSVLVTLIPYLFFLVIGLFAVKYGLKYVRNVWER